MNAQRISALLRKELSEYRASPGTLLPLLVILVLTIWLPLVVLVLVPKLTGESLAADEDLLEVVRLLGEVEPSLRALPPEAAAQAALLQHFLLLFLIGPIVGAVSLAAYGIVGEKQQRTLEPLLTTPLTTIELLVAKVFAALIPALVAELAGVAIFFTMIGLLAAPGVLGALLTFKTALLLTVVSPLAALTALQMAIAISTRVSDPRSAQQIAVVVVLPIVGLMIGQIAGAFVIGTGILLLMAAVLAGVWLAVARVSVALFDRETILTRWK